MASRSDKERRKVGRRRSKPRSESGGETAQRPSDQRQHPRYEKNLAVRIFKRSSGRGAKRDQVSFSAHVDTRDISAGGVFLQSTFFIKKGTQLELELDLPEFDRTVTVSGEVARVIDDPRRGPSGFAIRFVEYHDQAEIYLRAFLSRGNMFAFVDEHAPQIFPNVSRAQRARLVELIVRWEIYQEELDG